MKNYSLPTSKAKEGEIFKIYFYLASNFYNVVNLEYRKSDIKIFLLEYSSYFYPSSRRVGQNYLLKFYYILAHEISQIMDLECKYQALKIYQFALPFNGGRKQKLSTNQLHAYK